MAVNDARQLTLAAE